jgi:uncharacterized protein (TIGR00251 family)
VGRIAVRVQPRAKRNEIAGQRGEALLIRVTAPPVDGKANDAVRKLIARRVGVGVTRVELVRGAGAREKVLRLHGVSADRLRGFLENICNTQT